MDKKIALFTGCSSGIGLYCAQQLNKNPAWRVFATARKPEDVRHLQSQGLESVQLDLNDSSSIKNALTTITQQTDNKIDALFNNGAYGQPGAVEDLSRHCLRQQFETNVFGTQELTNAVIALMRKNGSGGRIIQNSSVLGFVALKYRGAYNASKYALEGLTDTMRLELKGSGIQLILIEPGPITSRFRENANAMFESTFNDEAINKSAHAAVYKNRNQGAPVPFTLGPEAVYTALLHALESPKPRLRYRVTLPTKIFWWLKCLLPTSVLDRLLNKF